MPAKITIAVKKGGAGKTATAVNVAALFARIGKRTLLVDLDEQGNAGSAFGIDEEYLQKATLEEVFEGKASIVDAISEIEEIPALNVSRNGRYLESVTTVLASKNQMFSIKAVRKLLEPIMEAYDFIILDTAPNFQPLAQSALLAADKIVVPLMDANGLDGLLDVKSLIEEAKEIIGREIEVRPLLTRANIKAQAFKELQKMVIEEGFTPYPEPIPVDENHNKAQVTLEPVVMKKKPSRSFKAYESLVGEIK